MHAFSPRPLTYMQLDLTKWCATLSSNQIVPKTFGRRPICTIKFIIFLPHIGPRGSWDGRVEAGVDYRWILHRFSPSRRVSLTVADHQLHQRPATTSNDQQRPATTSNDQQRPATTSNDH
ncbi:hypothetical protein N7450_011564 [Penicillium hetheringtonii]|uniref:Uncharacterized protein n=1 Tax=Penicillium hetheringtonii TaxID=911720 RepID=A0AAD6DAI4_9EURO|nr:hypothetical protein N7450_011564 [Penicillium hetheringtonii]